MTITESFIIIKINDNFFKISKSCIFIYFHKILDKSNIERTKHSPRLHDLRHTFIVHNFEKAIKAGKDISNFMSILQIYVGHKSITSLEYYFTITNNMIEDVNKTSEDKYGYLIPEMEELDYEE